MLRTTSSNAPAMPNATPATFCREMGSRRNSAASSMTTTGLNATMSEKCTGVVYCRLTAVRYCDTMNPMKPPKAISSRSRTLTFSFSANRLAAQKHRVATAVRESM